MKESTLAEITEVDGGGFCYSIFGPFPYYVGEGGVCITVHVQ